MTLSVIFSISFNCFAQSPTISSKIVGLQRNVKFYDGETLKKNGAGEVTSGYLFFDETFFPQGGINNILFRAGSLIIFNDAGKVLQGTVGDAYQLKTTSGKMLPVLIGDEVEFNSKGEIVIEAEKRILEKYAEVCFYSTKVSSTIPLYCKTVSTDYGNILVSGIIAEANHLFSPCENNVVKAKRNTRIEFFKKGDYGAYIKTDLERGKAEDKLNECIDGTVRIVTIDGPHKFFVYGSGYEIEFPDGSEIEFGPRVLKPAIYFNVFNYVISVKLGKDAMIPALGLVKKGRRIHSVHTFEDGRQASQGHLEVVD